MAGRGTPAVTAARRAGLAHTIHEVVVERTPCGYGRAVADAIGADPARVFKTLVVRVDDRLAVAIVPVDDEAELKAVAAALGAKRATMAAPADAERATGYVVGGISPLGQRRRLPTVLDATAMTHDTVFVSGGRRGLELELDPVDLVRATAAVVARITA
jgi:Cys-tRNA(Pro)/Cys-tRNA(Cys) deacylase